MRWLCLGREAGQDDLQRPLPSSTILWFSERGRWYECFSCKIIQSIIQIRSGSWTSGIHSSWNFISHTTILPPCPRVACNSSLRQWYHINEEQHKQFVHCQDNDKNKQLLHNEKLKKNVHYLANNILTFFYTSLFMPWLPVSASPRTSKGIPTEGSSTGPLWMYVGIVSPRLVQTEYTTASKMYTKYRR